jgi:DnaJ-class molecular chaperone
MTRAERRTQAEWLAGADLDDRRFDDDDECPRCHGDGMDPWNDHLLPCPLCQGEQTP